jgi:3-phosphoglycerate kinase
VQKLRNGQVLLLENLRFHKEEEANDAEFAADLGQLAQAYVNDAFGSAHRAHASTEGVAAHLPSYAGLLMKKELEVLGGALHKPTRPFVAVLGGAKVSGKIDVIRNLLPRVDALCIGGAMAFTFSRALGGSTGDSLVEHDKVDLAKTLVADARERGVELLLPVDVIVTKDLKGAGETRAVPFGEVPAGWKGVDIGPRTVERFGEKIVRAKTVLVNGPMGIFEVFEFAVGTCGVLAAVADCDGTTIVGGGDSAAAIGQCGFAEDVTHVSTGGGASLEFLEGRTLPGVAALARHARTATSI